MASLPLFPARPLPHPTRPFDPFKEAGRVWPLAEWLIDLADSGACGRVVSVPGPRLRLSDEPDAGISIRDALDGWRVHMAARGKRPKSYLAYQARVNDLCRFHDWRFVSDLSYPGAIKYLAAKREKGWSGATLDWTVVCLRSFGVFMESMDIRKPNPFARLEGVKEGGDRGARPFSPEEVTRLITTFAERMLRSARSKGNPALWIAFLAYTGLRMNEAKSIQWKDLSIDGDEPFYETNPRWAKSKRRDRVPIRRDLAAALRAHRDGLPVQSPEGAVFPIRPNRASFQSVREQAGIEFSTFDGDATPHGIRKSLATWLDANKCSPGCTATITRHFEGVCQERYVRPPWAVLREAVEALPTILPTFLAVRLDKLGCDRRYSRSQDRSVGLSMQHNPNNTVREEFREGGKVPAVLADCCDPVSRTSSSIVAGRNATGAAFAAPIEASNAEGQPQSESTSIGNGQRQGTGDAKERESVTGHDLRQLSDPDSGASLRGTPGRGQVLLASVRGHGRVEEGQRDGDVPHPGINTGGTHPGERAGEHAGAPGCDGEADRGLHGLRRDGQAAGYAPRGLQQASGGRTPLPVLSHEAAPEANQGRVAPCGVGATNDNQSGWNQHNRSEAPREGQGERQGQRDESLRSGEPRLGGNRHADGLHRDSHHGSLEPAGRTDAGAGRVGSTNTPGDVAGLSHEPRAVPAGPGAVSPRVGSVGDAPPAEPLLTPPAVAASGGGAGGGGAGGGGPRANPAASSRAANAENGTASGAQREVQPSRNQARPSPVDDVLAAKCAAFKELVKLADKWFVVLLAVLGLACAAAAAARHSPLPEPPAMAGAPWSK